MTSFRRAYALLTLVIFLLTGVIALGDLLLVTVADIPVAIPMGTKGLMLFVMNHLEVFFFCLMAYSVAAVAASIGLLRRRKWASLLWIVLICLALVWCITVVIVEVIAQAPVTSLSMGLLPPFDQLGSLLVIPFGVFLILLLALVLRAMFRLHSSL